MRGGRRKQQDREVDVSGSTAMVTATTRRRDDRWRERGEDRESDAIVQTGTVMMMMMMMTMIMKVLGTESWRAQVAGRSSSSCKRGGNRAQRRGVMGVCWTGSVALTVAGVGSSSSSSSSSSSKEVELGAVRSLWIGPSLVRPHSRPWAW